MCLIENKFKWLISQSGLSTLFKNIHSFIAFAELFSENHTSRFVQYKLNVPVFLTFILQLAETWSPQVGQLTKP